MTDGRLPVRIYWEDTDAGGVVYHASYLRFMERGRTELLRERGVDQGELAARSGLIFVVTHMEIAFRSPARIDEQIAVETRVTKVGGASLSLKQIVRRGDEILSEADVVCAAIHRDTGRPMRLPADVKASLGL